MNMNQVHYILALAEALSFSEAAKVCGVTQPTLSNGISHLEKELGEQLFERTARYVTITPYGESVLPFMNILSVTHSGLINNTGSDRREG